MYTTIPNPAEFKMGTSRHRTIQIPKIGNNQFKKCQKHVEFQHSHNLVTLFSKSLIYQLSNETYQNLGKPPSIIRTSHSYIKSQLDGFFTSFRFLLHLLWWLLVVSYWTYSSPPIGHCSIQLLWLSLHSNCYHQHYSKSIKDLASS